MSLKKFHILFITLSTLCLVGFGAWCFFGNFQLTNGFAGDLMKFKYLCGITSIVLGLITSIYGVWFYRKKIKYFEITESL
ncbi:MAG: hypothetical protein ACJ0K4_08095 [Verrucomicrobiales bacterium]|nr:MAG: hypothetical protein EVB09_05600 [Verrucomicrobiaceae bacterium]